MKTIHLLLMLLLVAGISLSQGSERVLVTVYQPLDPMVDSSVEVYPVPLLTSGAFPEVFFEAITRPHIPQHLNAGSGPVGDVNVASRAGISIRCESAAAGQTKLYIIWDFSKADPKQMNDKLIDALILCLEKSAGKSIGLYSKFVGDKEFAGYKARIIARIPEQTAEQLKADSGLK